MANNASLKMTRKLISGMTIPSRPTVMLEVIKGQNTFAPDLQKVADVISRDVVLSSRILQEANTTLPGLKRKVASIEQAVMLLGLTHVRKVVTSLFLSASLVGKAAAINRLRHRCSEVARVAAAVADELPRVSAACLSGYLPAIPPDEAYALGLFHDCGLSMLMQKFADYEGFYEEVRKEGRTSLIKAEDDRFRTNHCLVGYLLCEQWKLPRAICDAIRDHHRFTDFVKPGKKVKDRRTLTLQAILKLAEWINGELSVQEWEEVRDSLLRFLDMGDAELEQLRTKVARTLETPAEAG